MLTYIPCFQKAFSLTPGVGSDAPRQNGEPCQGIIMAPTRSCTDTHASKDGVGPWRADFLGTNPCPAPRPLGHLIYPAWLCMHAPGVHRHGPLDVKRRPVRLPLCLHRASLRHAISLQRRGGGMCVHYAAAPRGSALLCGVP